MPGKVNPENQAAFMSRILRPAIEKAKSGAIELFGIGSRE
jgi:hypothetical protein